MTLSQFIESQWKHAVSRMKVLPYAHPLYFVTDHHKMPTKDEVLYHDVWKVNLNICDTAHQKGDIAGDDNFETLVLCIRAFSQVGPSSIAGSPQNCKIGNPACPKITSSLHLKALNYQSHHLILVKSDLVSVNQNPTWFSRVPDSRH